MVISSGNPDKSNFFADTIQLSFSSDDGISMLISAIFFTEAVDEQVDPVCASVETPKLSSEIVSVRPNASRKLIPIDEKIIRNASEKDNSFND